MVSGRVRIESRVANLRAHLHALAISLPAQLTVSRRHCPSPTTECAAKLSIKDNMWFNLQTIDSNVLEQLLSSSTSVDRQSIVCLLLQSLLLSFTLQHYRLSIQIFANILL